MVFENLSDQSNWPAILSELGPFFVSLKKSIFVEIGFTELESGALLRLIEERSSKASQPILLVRKIGIVLEMLLMSRESRIWFGTLAAFSGIILIVVPTKRTRKQRKDEEAMREKRERERRVCALFEVLAR